MFSLECQLKRVADLLVSVLLVLTALILLLSMFGIWLEDRGPVFYFQERRLVGMLFSGVQVADDDGFASGFEGGLDCAR